jgi:hypothetical protein
MSDTNGNDRPVISDGLYYASLRFSPAGSVGGGIFAGTTDAPPSGQPLLELNVIGERYELQRIIVGAMRSWTDVSDSERWAETVTQIVQHLGPALDLLWRRVDPIRGEQAPAPAPTYFRPMPMRPPEPTPAPASRPMPTPADLRRFADQLMERAKAMEAEEAAARPSPAAPGVP